MINHFTLKSRQQLKNMYQDLILQDFLMIQRYCKLNL